jgi:hypothetical protein
MELAKKIGHSNREYSLPFWTANKPSKTGRTIWIADAHRGDGKRFVVHADQKLTAFVGLESAIQVGPTFFTAMGRQFRLAIC